MGDQYEEFRQYRQRMNERILSEDHKLVKRFFALDRQAYEPGTALDTKTKELLGLVASLVLRCDDCVSYHLSNCLEQGATRDEIYDTLGIGLIVGGSITIPHMRRAVDLMDELSGSKEQG